MGASPFPTVRFGAEELTFNYELTRSGALFFFDPAVAVTHVNRTTRRAFVDHQWVLGLGSAMARRLVPLPGTILIRHPALIPLLPLYRLARLLRRVAARHPRELPRVLALSPVLLIGYGYWAAGFWKGRRESLDVWSKS